LRSATRICSKENHRFSPRHGYNPRPFLKQRTSMPLQEEVSKRRTFAIISHPDAGKTTLTEKLLLFGGLIQLMQ